MMRRTRFDKIDDHDGQATADLNYVRMVSAAPGLPLAAQRQSARAGVGNERRDDDKIEG